MNKVIDKGFRSCRFVSTIVKHPVLAAERGLNCRSFDSHLRSKLLQCGEDTHTLSQVHNTRLYRGVTRLDSAWGTEPSPESFQ